MSKLSKLAFIAALTVAGAVQAHAAQTNLIQSINMTITAYTEGDTVTNGVIVNKPVLKRKASSKDIVQLLGDAMGVTFSTQAKLMLVSPLPDGESSVVVQDGTNRVDVSGFFDGSDSDTEIEGGQINTSTGIAKGTLYQILELELRDNGPQVLDVHFKVAGLATVKSASIVKGGGVIGTSHSLSAILAGTGDFMDDDLTPPVKKDMVVQVTLTTTGNKLEVLP